MNTTPQAERNETAVSFRLKSGEMEGLGRGDDESGVDGAVEGHDGSVSFREATGCFAVWTNSFSLMGKSINLSGKSSIVVE